jgi:hypothetical protein
MSKNTLWLAACQNFKISFTQRPFYFALGFPQKPIGEFEATTGRPTCHVLEKFFSGPPVHSKNR